MLGQATPDVSSPDALIDSVTAAAATAAQPWFPELRGRPRIRLVASHVRSRCLLYRMEVSDGRVARPIMVKVRHSDPALRRARNENRPQMAPVRTMPDDVTAAREYQGLVLIRDALARHPEAAARFGVLRPLTLLPDHCALVVDFVGQPTLRTAMLGTSPLSRLHRRRAPEQAWHNAGAWLRVFHEQPADQRLPARAQDADGIAELFRQFTGFLMDQIGRRPLLAELHDAGREFADAALPSAVPLATGHGDFVPNNMFTTPQGRITVFDPLPMWRLPVYQDLATFTVGLRVLAAQAATRGRTFPQRTLLDYESAVVRGYFGDDPIPHPALRTFQLLLLLDRWSSLVSRNRRTRGLRAPLHEAFVDIVSRRYHREATRLFRQLVEG